jgi:hypothetical protein
MQQIHQSAIELAKAYSNAKYNSEEISVIYPDRDRSMVFRESDLGREVHILESKYDDLLKAFQSRFRARYDPLKGRRNGGCSGHPFLRLSVDGKSYDRIYKPPRLSAWAKLASMGVACFVALISVLVGHLVENQFLRVLIGTLIAIPATIAFIAVLFTGVRKD